MEIKTFILLALMPLVVWRVYMRLKAALGRNRSELWRHYAGAVILLGTLGIVAAQVLGDIESLGALAVGAAAGAALAFLNLRRSRLENTRDGFFYRQDARIGILIVLLCLARLMYRMFALFLQMQGAEPAAPEFIRTPLTAVMLGVMLAYFGGYQLLLARWRRGQKPVPRGGVGLD
ncbi:hypothetical protein ACLB1G_08735 [Oxalobacteraceae bacterium A2-2]